MTAFLQHQLLNVDTVEKLSTVTSVWPWVGFTLFVLAMLAIDLLIFHREAHTVKMREALAWSIVWVTLALIFCAGVWYLQGRDKGLEFLTGYLIEKALSVDNLFVFLVIFAYFKVPPALQHRVLFWGILGALIMRAIFIFAGALLIARFWWMIPVLGGLLILIGIKMFFAGEGEEHPERNPVVRLFQRFVPMVARYDGSKFFTVENGKRYATPLLLVLVTVEATDVVFAVDSIPAIFAITTDVFIVYTSNIFAILGLRALFFLLAGSMDKFHHLKTGLAFILVFVGVKMLLHSIWHIKISTPMSLGVIAATLALAVIASLLRPQPMITPEEASEAIDKPIDSLEAPPAESEDSKQKSATKK
jgi:tellurite resistance protein TerC